MHDPHIASTIPELPLYRRSRNELTDAYVSTTSGWTDKRWIYDNRTPGVSWSAGTIVWNVDFADGSTLLDTQHAELLDWLRRWASSMIEAPGDGARPMAPGSASALSGGMATFLRWMVSRGCRWPSDLCADTLDAWLIELPEVLANEVDDSDDDEEMGLSLSRTWRALRIPLLIWRQRMALGEVGVPPMPEQPYRGATALGLAKTIATRAVGWIRPLPDEVALAVTNRAGWFLGTPADDVVALQTACKEAYDRNFKGAELHQTTTRRNINQLEAALAFRFSSPPGSDGAWHEPLTRGSARGGNAGAMQRVRQLVKAVRSAAIAAVQSGTGMRISEVCGLPFGLNATTGLPVCIRIERSATGLNELFLCRTVVSKAEAVPRDVDWVIGMRPRGSNDLPLPVRALMILNQLALPYQHLIKANNLLIQFRTAVGLPKTLAGIGVLTSNQVRNELKDFVSTWVDLSHLPDQSEHAIEPNDLVPWKESRGRILKSHQFRKMFASFALSVDTRLLPALQMHFHHLNQSITEGGYWGKNRLQVEPLSTVQAQQSNLLMYEMALGRTPVAGRMGETLMNQLEHLRDRIGGRTPADGWNETVRFVNEYDLRLWFASHGNCLPLVPVKMRCHEVAGTSSWLNRRPNFSTRQPGICAGCSCFVIDARHRAFWQERFEQNWLAFRRAEIAGMGDAFRVIRDRGWQARLLLQRIGVSTAEIERKVEEEIHHAT